MKLTLSPILVLLALAAAGPAGARSSCHLPGGRTIATDRVAKLIALPAPGGDALFACIRRTGRKVALDDSYADARLAGRWVGWQRHAGGKWRIDVHDLRSGRERLVDGHVAEASLFLTTTGTAVWAQAFDQGFLVFANDVRTGGHLLDSGAIEPRSLRLSGRRASWRKDGALYSADVR
ncbi:MAG: hypothetical protein ACJ76Z_08875 [Thermoleophilaceae bacterium]